MMNKIESVMDRLVVLALRGVAATTGVIGGVFCVLSAFTVFVVMPEMIVAVVIGGALVTASTWFWKKANKVAAARNIL